MWENSQTLLVCTAHAHCLVAQPSVIFIFVFFVFFLSNVNVNDSGVDRPKQILLNLFCLCGISMCTPPPLPVLQTSFFFFMSALSCRSACTLHIILYTFSLNLPFSLSLFSSVAKERRTLTSSSRAPSPSSHHQTSWLSPTSTRPSSPASPSSTRSLCTRCLVPAYEKDWGNLNEEHPCSLPPT